MSNQQQQGLPPIQNSREPSEESKHTKAVFDDLESKQLDTLDESGKSIIERIATFLGILFGISILSNNFPPPYLKGNSFAKIMIIISLVCFLLSIGAGILATQVRSYRRYTYNMTMTGKEQERLIRYKMLWLKVANLLFALGTIALAVLLIIVVLSL